jgi:hypothetical protein
MPTNVADFVGLDAYRAPRQHLFPSEGSLQWFIRRQRERLIAAGALKLHAGRWLAHQASFDAVVIEVATAAAERHRAA